MVDEEVLVWWMRRCWHACDITKGSFLSSRNALPGREGFSVSHVKPPPLLSLSARDAQRGQMRCSAGSLSKHIDV